MHRQIRVWKKFAHSLPLYVSVYLTLSHTVTHSRLELITTKTFCNMIRFIGSLYVEWGWEWAGICSELYYIYSHSTTVHRQIRVWRTWMKQCADFIGMEQLVAT